MLKYSRYFLEFITTIYSTEIGKIEMDVAINYQNW